LTAELTTPQSKHVFVSGLSRSGTTLLQLVLSAHPMVTITPEQNFIQEFFKTNPVPDRVLSEAQLAKMIEMMREDIKLNTWPGFNLDGFLATLPDQEYTIAQILDALFVHFADLSSRGTHYLGNKKGLYLAGYGPLTKQVFPDAKFIYIVRDPRDTIRSIVANIAYRSLTDEAIRCTEATHQIAEMETRYPGDVLTVRYEDLVTDPKAVCQTLCKFLAIPFDEQMLRFYELNRDGSMLIGVTREIHPNTSSPFNPELVGQWKKQNSFTPNQLRTIESFAYPYMKRFGYELEEVSGGTQVLLAQFRTRLQFRAKRLKGALVNVRQRLRN
jgi:hypothetical protein